MKFNSKSYLYYALEDKLTCNEFLIKNKFDTLGEFSIRPGTLKLVEDQEDYAKYLTGDFAFNKFSDCISIKLYALDADIILHYKSSLSYIKINLKSDVLYFTLMSQNNGLYLFNSKGYYNEGEAKNCPVIEYYDNSVLECLLNEYNIEEENILKLNHYSLKKLGFEPDETTITNWDELGSNDYHEFIINILNNYSQEDLLNKLNNIDKSKQLIRK